MNPLLQYKEDHKLLWKDLEEQTGLSKNALIQISRLGKEQMAHVRLGTVVKLYTSIGINLFEHIITKA